MQLIQERPDFDFFMRGADGVSALVNERRLERSFIIAPDRLVEDWPVRDVRTLAVAELEALFALGPELILLGCGATQAFPPAATMAASRPTLPSLTSAASSVVAGMFSWSAAPLNRPRAVAWALSASCSPCTILVSSQARISLALLIS